MYYPRQGWGACCLREPIPAASDLEGFSLASAGLFLGGLLTPQDEGSCRCGCMRDVPFCPLTEAHALAACLIWWHCIFRCFPMGFHWLVAERGPGWAGWCVLSTGHGKLQCSAQKSAFCCPVSEMPPCHLPLYPSSKRGQSLLWKQMFLFEICVFSFE